MADAIGWITTNWLTVVGTVYVLDKVAKLTPTKYDDFVVDVLGDFLKIVTGKKRD